MSEETHFDNMEAISSEEESKKVQDRGKGCEEEAEERLGVDEPESVVKGVVKEVTTNAYVGKRNFIHQMMDVALMMANVSQLKALLVSENNDYFYILFTFIIMSIALQVIFTVCMLAIWSVEKTIEDENRTHLKQSPNIERKKRMAAFLDRLGNVLVLFIIVSNVFITGFGVESHASNPSSTLSKTQSISSLTTSTPQHNSTLPTVTKF